MTRKYQDTNFIVEELNGLEVSKLIGLVELKQLDNSPILINLKVKNDNRCFRFFLDAGLAFWEEWSDFEEYQDDETREVDYAKAYNISNKSIKNIICMDSTINITFEKKEKFILKFKDENDIDSDSVIQFIK